MFTPFLKEDNFLNREPFVKDEVRFNVMHRIAAGDLAIGVKHEDKLLALQTPNRPMMIWVNNSLSRADWQQALTGLIEYIKPESINGVMAEPDMALYFAQKYSADYNLNYECRMNLMSYHCLKVINPTVDSGNMRLAAAQDLNTVVEFRVAYIRETLDKEVEADSQIEIARKQIDSNRLYVWETAAGLVSMAYITHVSQRHSRISCVYTPPAARCQGYAGSLVAQLCSKILQSDSTPVLFTNLRNPVSNHVYKKIGFTECGPIDEIYFVS